jgi:hypothetical protein
MKRWFPWVALLLVWVLIIAVVDPRGEFMVNDDWAFVRCLEAFRSTGALLPTGWGPPGAPGGPSLLVHLLVGDLCSRIFGFSLTHLRLAVLTLGLLGSFGLLLLFRLTGAPPWLGLLATLTVVANPLFLAECFTYMTDITFASLAIFALLCLYLGVKRESSVWIIGGLLLVLASVLTRQIGLVLLLAFLVTCWVHPGGAALGRWKMLSLGLGLVVLPWVLYEILLSHVGSSSVMQHQVISDLFNFPKEKGFWDYLAFLGTSLFLGYLGYVACFVSPLLLESLIAAGRRRSFRYLLWLLALLVVVLEWAIVTRRLHLPVIFPGNIIYNFGLGPILLKDTYILKIPRLAVIGQASYYLLASWAALAVCVLLGRCGMRVRSWWQVGFPTAEGHRSFLACLTLLASLFYLGIITPISFHDRYLIPVIIFLVIWLVLDRATIPGEAVSLWKIIPGFALVICLGVWSTVNVHDFMELERGLKKARDYALQELGADPCRMDGGFEFNGYYCYRNDFQPRPGLSWWWVSGEDYLITLGPLPGYRVLRRFPFSRYVEPPGTVYLLQPMIPAASGD